MSDFTESSNRDTRASADFNQAIDAFDRGELEFSELCRKALELCEPAGQDEVSAVYGRLGGIAYWRGDFHAAEEWYRKSLEIDQRIGDEHGAATTCHYLSATANAREDFESAEKWAWKSIHIKEKQGDEIGAAESYHQLGLVAYRRGNLDAADQWYRKSLEIEESNGNEHGAAETYNNMSAVANARGDFESAEKWLWKSIHIKEKQGNKIGVAVSYHQLGVVANSRQDFNLFSAHLDGNYFELPRRVQWCGSIEWVLSFCKVG
jgi:tetratricopeptide (TPR) repeat protein